LQWDNEGKDTSDFFQWKAKEESNYRRTLALGGDMISFLRHLKKKLSFNFRQLMREIRNKPARTMYVNYHPGER